MKTYSVGPGGERTRQVACWSCGSGHSRSLWKGEGFRFVRCAGCGLVYQNPQPVFQDLKGRYAERYFRYELANERNFHRLMELGLEDIRFHQRSRGLAAPRRFLDVGCATGLLLAGMRERGWEVRGVELCRESAEYGIRTRGVEIAVGTLQEAAFPEGFFGVAHFSHLIEHLPDPPAFMREVHRILVPGGWMVVVTPNVNGLQARLFRERWRSAIADHLTLFSAGTLKRLLERSGFEVLARKTWGGLAQGTAPAWLKRPADVLAKRLGFGDVVLYWARRV